MCDKPMGVFSSCFIQSQFKRNVVTYSIDVCVATYHVRQINKSNDTKHSQRNSLLINSLIVKVYVIQKLEVCFIIGTVKLWSSYKGKI